MINKIDSKVFVPEIVNSKIPQKKVPEQKADSVAKKTLSKVSPSNSCCPLWGRIKKAFSRAIGFLARKIAALFSSTHASDRKASSKSSPLSKTDSVTPTQKPIQQVKPATDKPKGIENYENSCYLTSLLQVIANSPYLKKTIQEVGSSGKKNEVKSAIKNRLRSLLEVYKRSGDQSERLQGEMLKLRNQAFSSGFNKQFTKNTRAMQQDITEMADLLFNTVLGIQSTEMITMNFPTGETIVRENDMCPLMRVGIPDAAKGIDLAKSVYEEISDQVLPTGTTENHAYLTPPPVLFVAINRFSYQVEKKNGKRVLTKTKLNTPVKFESELRVPIIGGTAGYTLNSFVVHHGNNVNSGHYTVYVKRSSGWYHCDGDLVTPVSSERVQQAMRQMYFASFDLQNS